MQEIKKCIICGQNFVATSSMQKVCKRIHYDNCVVCGKEFEIPKNRLLEKDRSRCCSRKCSSQLRKRTCLNIYGGDAPASSKSVREKMEQTCLKRFGVKHAAQNKDIQEKMRISTFQKYGVDWYTQTDEWRRKTRSTSESKYGTDWPATSQAVRSRCKLTNIERYGVSNPMQSDIVKSRFISSHMQDNSKLDSFIEYKEDPRKFITSLGLDHKPTIYELSTILGVNESTVGLYLYKHNCKDIVNYRISVMEQEVRNFILEICPQARVDMNVHNVICPNELDIYLPEYQIAIECNPTATHNSTINVFDPSGDILQPRYHLMKSTKCEDAGIFLLHIFGSEWTYKRPILESMIRNLLGNNTRRIYARQCNVDKIDGRTCCDFLNSNHRQGNVNSPIRLGLFLDKELVSVMTFGRVRSSIGKDGSDLSDCWELVRFCSLLNTSVIGGADKLLKHFIRTYQPSQIRSFSDRAHTRGTLYQKLGFNKVRESDPGYAWVDSRTDISYHRYCGQKQNIKKFLKDDSIDLSKTEKQIMEEHGFLQVFDSGTILWEWTNK